MRADDHDAGVWGRRPRAMVAVQLGATEALVAWAGTSVTSNDTPAAAWRKAQVTRLTASILVRGRASVFGVVVTQLVTQRRTRPGKGAGPLATALIAIMRTGHGNGVGDDHLVAVFKAALEPIERVMPGIGLRGGIDGARCRRGSPVTPCGRRHRRPPARNSGPGHCDLRPVPPDTARQLRSPPLGSAPAARSRRPPQPRP